jgi:hypothetical protein
MSGEREFRTNTVLPFLKKLKNTFFLPVQQMAISGSPDYLLCVNGRYVALELKGDDGIVSKLQAHTLEKMRRTGAVTFVAMPKNWDEIKSKLLLLSEGEKWL